MKKVLCCCLLLALVLSVIPLPALADETESTERVLEYKNGNGDTIMQLTYTAPENAADGTLSVIGVYEFSGLTGNIFLVSLPYGAEYVGVDFPYGKSIATKKNVVAYIGNTWSLLIDEIPSKDIYLVDGEFDYDYITGKGITGFKNDDLIINGEIPTENVTGFLFRGFSRSAYAEAVFLQISTVEPHEHVYGDPSYVWADDNSTCTATVTCTAADCDGSDGATVTETVDTTSETTPASCESKGKTVYTATFTNELFETQTKEVEIEAAGHKYGEPEWTWNEDYTEASATFTCANDAEHVETVAATITSERTEPTFEAEGKIVYTAKVTFGEVEYTDEKTVVLDKLEYTFPDDSNDFNAEQGKDFVLTVKRSADDDKTLGLFEKLLIDEVEVAKTNYTLQKGSVIITLKGEFIKTLTAGEHTVKVVFSDGGVVEHTLTVKAASTSPKTADEASLVLYVVMAAAAMTAMAGVVVVQRKRKEQ